MFDENIFDVTFRKAIEEKDNPSTSSSSSLRRMISIQNEDTLHTPHIPLHLYREQGKEEGDSGSDPDDVIIVEDSLPESPPRRLRPAALAVAPTPRPLRPVRQRVKRNVRSKLMPPPEILPLNTPRIPINFPDKVRIQPKWTVMLQYPTVPVASDKGPVGTVKERLQAYLVKNETNMPQTVSLTPKVPEKGSNEPAAAVLNLIVDKKDEERKKEMLSRKESSEKSPDRKGIRQYSNGERNNEAAKRYRKRKAELMDKVIAKNQQLEEENRTLRMQNKELIERLNAALKEGKGPS